MTSLNNVHFQRHLYILDNKSNSITVDNYECVVTLTVFELTVEKTHKVELLIYATNVRLSQQESVCLE